jgi:arylsulfatase A-like enzyme
MIKQIKNILILLLALFLWNGCEQAEEKKETDKPNIILFLVDDLGWQDTSEPFWTEITPNNKKYRTPNMEILADQGMKFTQAYACAVCSPTRVSLISGMNAARHRVTNWTLKRNQNAVAEPKNLEIPKWNVNGVQACDSIENAIYVTPLPQILSENGYTTIHCGKAHFGAMTTPAENPENLGFNINIAGHAAGGPGSYQGEHHFSANWRGGGSIWDVPGLEKYHGQEINLTEALTREAILAVDSISSLGQNFYLYMAHYGVHTPLEPDHRFYQKYKDLGYEEPEARYASMVESVDKSLGDLMNFLSETGLDDNTIILLMSDNGGLSAVARGGEPHTHNLPLSSGKGSAREGGIREPMIVKWPQTVKASSVCDEYLIVEDFFPSILEMAQIQEYKTIQTIDGQSFVPMLKQEAKKDDEPRPLVWHYPNNWGPQGPGIGASSSIRLGDWKMIYYHDGEKFELFNLKKDIGETNNLAETNTGKLKELAEKLTDYLISVDAQMPINKNTGEVVNWPANAIE